jgi:hypothetical protein
MSFYLLLLSLLPPTAIIGLMLWRWRARFSEAGAVLAWFFGMLCTATAFGQAGALKYLIGDWAALAVALLVAPAVYVLLWNELLRRTRFRIGLPRLRLPGKKATGNP